MSQVQLPGEVLARIVREARCATCDGKGFQKVPGEARYVDCRDCHGDGIHLGVCRRLAADYAGKP